MKKPIVGNYNYTPQQMARINAQREASGRAPLASYNQAQNDPSYDEYYNEIKKRAGGEGIKKSQYDLDKEEESDISIEDRIKKMSSDSAKKREAEQKAFKEMFRKQQMLPQGMSGMRGGVSYSPNRYGSSAA
jgi:hypothetical protein